MILSAAFANAMPSVELWVSNDTVLPQDTSAVASDTVKSKPKVKKRKIKSAVDDKVTYKADDSTYINLEDNKLYLIKKGEVHYEDITLTADYIVVDLDKKEISAKGLTDSTGKITGKPHFVEGKEAFDADAIRYNFKTKKGIITNTRTKASEGYLISERTKQQADNSVCLTGGKFTTCSLEHPHYYFKLTKAKVIPNDKIVTGPAYLVIEDIPTPIFLPFAFFPNQKKHASGVIIPDYGQENNRGFFLRKGGYYFAINDYVDLKLLGDVYSFGSWGAHVVSRYRRRYRYSGNINLDYAKIIISEKGLDNYREANSYWVKWNYNQDNKAHPNSSFRAKVNLGSSNYSRYNGVSFNQRLQNTVQSNIAYSLRFPRSPFNMSVNIRHSQNNKDSTMNLSVPEMALNMRRIYPLKRKHPAGKTRWYEKIGLTYTGNMRNTIKLKQKDFYKLSDLGNYQNGIKNTVPISTSLRLLKYFNLNPRMTYTERWYFKSYREAWMDTSYDGSEMVLPHLAVDTLNGFVRAGDYSVSVPLTTKLYGLFQFKGESPKIKAIRHMMTPSVGFVYRPDYSQDKYGYYRTIENDSSDTYYSIFGRNAIYGVPPTGKYGSIRLGLNNNVEMKWRDGVDTSTTYKKVPLLQAFNINTYYNMAADSMNWSNANISARTMLGRFINLSLSAIVNPYAMDSNGVVYDDLLWSKGQLGRLTASRMALGFSLNNRSFGKKTKKKTHENVNNGYSPFSIPWNVSVSYNLSYTKPQLESKVLQTMRVSGNVDFTKNWKANFTIGYDLTNKKFTYPSFRMVRDLHCWQMALNIIPFGRYQSYNFQINVKASMLKDMKYNLRRNWTEYL